MKRIVVFLVSISIICLLSGTVFAEVGVPGFSKMEVGPALSSTRENAAPPVSKIALPPAYGTSDWLELNLPMMGMTPLGDGEWAYYSNGWAYQSGGSNSATCQKAMLPSGALIYSINTYTNDTDATNDIYYIFRRQDVSDDTSTTLLSWTSSGAPGVEKVERVLPGGNHTVDNHFAAYVLCIFHDTTGSALQSQGATIWYKLQISPAPSTATFTDVPTTHPFFREIESLASSGISTGYSDGTFKPGDYVTRQAMAAFLARALGLHYPDYK